jgi:membrane protease YdiL (CAAX protease family)
VINPYLNEREGRIRAFWRLLLQYTAYLFGASLLSSILLALIVLSAGGGVTTVGPTTLLVSSVSSLAAALFSVWLVGRYADRRPFSGFGMRLNRDWWVDLGFGLFLGALLMTGVFVVELALGWVTVTGVFRAVGGGAFFPAILAPVVIFLCVGIYEELVSRGYQITNLAEGLRVSLGPRGAVLLAWAISSVVFGALHAFNPNASVVSTVNIMLAGLMLGIGYVLTGRLGISIGLHITWNFFQGNVYGFPVSGLQPLGATVLSTDRGGPPLLTGGAFGPEAGLVGLTAMLVGTLLILLWVRARYGKTGIQTSLAEPPDAVKQANLRADTGR